MAYEPDIDDILNDDEDIKIWRGTTDEEQIGTKKRAAADKPSKAPSGKHSRKDNAKKAENSRPKKELKFSGIKYLQGIDRREILMLAVAVVLLAAASVPNFGGWKKALLYLVPFAAAGYDVAFTAGKKILNINLLEREIFVCLAAIIAFAIGEYSAAVLILIVFKITAIVEHAANKKEMQALEEIRSLSAGRARIETDDGVFTIGPEYVKVGDIVVVAPGDQIPTDGIVVEGISSIDLSPMTGVTESVAVNTGRKVCAGTINVTAPLKIQVTDTYDESTAARIADLVETAAEIRSTDEKQVFAIERYFTPAIFAAAVLTAIVPLFFGGEFREWARRAAILIVISSPAAMCISVPLTYFGSLVSAAKKGILIKGSNITALLAKLETVVFDKTGTITEGKYKISEVFPVNMSEEQLLSIAATAEQHSNHAIAKALKEAGEIQDVKVLTAEELSGRGISAFVDGRQVYVGNASLLEEHGIKYAIPSRPGAAVHVALDGKYCGHILITDKIRNGTFETIDNLRTQGARKMVMLTGDVLSVARPIANKLNFDMLRAELMPEDKASAVAYLTDNCPIDRALVFVGDGVNDADALKNADVGIAMNTLGNDEAMESADVAIMDGEIRKLPVAVQIAKLARLAALENILAVLVVKALIAVLALFGKIPVTAAVILDGVVSVGVIINSLRTFKDWTVINKKQKEIL